MERANTYIFNNLKFTAVKAIIQTDTTAILMVLWVTMFE